MSLENCRQLDPQTRAAARGHDRARNLEGGPSSFARFVAQELGPRGITVNVVAPGPVGGHLHNGALEHDQEHKQRLAAQTALGRLANPDDVARAVAFCAGGDSEFITGTTVPVDGGMAMD
jgi:3-oxoacyl-[acyl-carrier protein] reductase